MIVTWAGGVQLAVAVRGHTFLADQPTEDGGEDRGMTPVEMFVASLGACIGYFALRFCQRHQLPAEGLKAAVEWGYAERPRRISEIAVRLDLPKGFPSEMKDRLQKVVEGCTVQNSLTHPPKIEILLEGPPG